MWDTNGQEIQPRTPADASPQHGSTGQFGTSHRSSRGNGIRPGTAATSTADYLRFLYGDAERRDPA